MLFYRLLIFFKINIFLKKIRNTIRVSNTLDPDQARHFVGPDLGPNCLQTFSADDTSRQIVQDINIKLKTRGKLFPYFSTKTNVVGTQKSPLNVIARLCNHIICLD